MEIELAVITKKPGEGDGEGEDEESSLMDNAKEILTVNKFSRDENVDAVLSPKQQSRLRKLFDVSDRGHKGYLTKDELGNLLGKLQTIMPHTELLKLTLGEGTDSDVTWPQFLNIFAFAKGSGSQTAMHTALESIPERIGTYLLQAMSKSHAVKKVNSSNTAHPDPPSGGDYDYEEFIEGNRIILVNNRDHKKLEWTKAGAILRAALIGAFFAAICGLAELLLGRNSGYTGEFSGPAFDNASHTTIALFWSVVALVNIAATILEILCLYLDSLRAAALIAGYIGLDPWLLGYVNDMDHAATAIVRAAFELPHPSEPLLGIRPLRYSNRLNGFLRALLWKSKRGLTALLLGMFLKKLIPRASMKLASPFVAVPIAALWNSLVAWKVVCDIYSIVIGNIAISRVVTKVVEPRWRTLSENGRNLLYCVAGVAIALEQQIHPTLETLLRLLCRYWGDPPRRLPIDDKYFMQNTIVQCTREEQLLVLQLLAVATVSISHISLGSMRYLKKLLISCDLNPDEKGIDELRWQLSSSSYIDVEHITDLFRDSITKDKTRSCWSYLSMFAKVASYNFAY